MAEIKVLALDLDGTLTNDQKEVTPRTRAALDAAIERGVTVVLASGRPTAGITPLAKDWGWTKRAAASCPTTEARSWTAAPAKHWWKKTLDPALVPELCAFAAAQDVAILTYSSEGIVCERETDLGRQGDLTTKLPMIRWRTWPGTWTTRCARCSFAWTRTVGMPCAPPGGSSLPGAWTVPLQPLLY